MNYRHIYHAGSFADVFKHTLLISLIQELQRKPKPFCYLETHAGVSNYDLQAVAAQKTQEFATGILKLWPLKGSGCPDLINCYLENVLNWNKKHGDEELRYYPGSPRMVRNLLRSTDRMILAELHADDVLLLKREFFLDKQVAVHHIDGYQGLKAFLPPKEMRGLVLIDPPFEQEDEFAEIFQHLAQAERRWPQGTYAVWFPIKDKIVVKNFYHDLKVSGIREIIYCELAMPFLTHTGLQACGMLIIHPPWQWCDRISTVLPWLCKALSEPSMGSYTIQWLVKE